MKIKIKKHSSYDERICGLLALVVSLPLFTNAFGILSIKLLGTSLYTTILIYGVVLFRVYVIAFKSSPRIFMKYLKYLCLVLLFMVMNYAVFFESRIYFAENIIELLIYWLIYFLVAVYMLYVKSWNDFFKQMKWTTLLTPIFGILSIYYFDYLTYFSYMTFGLMILPGTLCSIYYIFNNSNKIYLLIGLMDVYLLVSFGNRMSFISMVVFSFLLFFVNDSSFSNKKKLIIAFILVLVLVSVSLLFNDLNAIIYDLFEPIFGESRTFERLFNGSLIDIDNGTNGRETIYELCKDGISNMGIKIGGLFGDRIYLSNYMSTGSYKTNYAHNIFYESLLSFGWVNGVAFTIYIIFNSIKTFFSNKYCKDYQMVFGFLFSLIFMRLIVSGSFLIEGQFILFLLLLMNKFRREDNENINR